MFNTFLQVLCFTSFTESTPSCKESEQTTFPTPTQDAIKALIGNPTPERINQFVELYGQNNLPDILKENK